MLLGLRFRRQSLSGAALAVFGDNFTILTILGRGSIDGCILFYFILLSPGVALPWVVMCRKVTEVSREYLS